LPGKEKNLLDISGEVCYINFYGILIVRIKYRKQLFFQLKGDKKMAASVNQETCVGCGACVDSCPLSAITIENDKAVVGDSCIECGACVASCPTEAITL